MPRELIFMSSQPDDLNYAWQVEVQINNFRKYGFSDKMHVLLYRPVDRFYEGWNPVWDVMEERYPEVKFFKYDDQGVFPIVQYLYKSIIRPHILWQHFEKFPELKDKAIFYHDCDIVFTQPLDFNPFLEDDIVYGSETDGYISSSYFDKKSKECPRLKDDVLDSTASLVGLNRQIIVKEEINSNGCIGAQYLLKNVDSSFWKKVEEDCIKIIICLRNFNNEYFIDEDAGFQSWCADMWALLWNLWLRGIPTKVHKDFDFAWATDPISKWNEIKIFHNAGVVGVENLDYFFKGKKAYVNNLYTPFDDVEYLNSIKDKYCSYNYVREILSTKVAISK